MSNVRRAYFDDGTLRAEGAILDGLPHGLHRQWHQNGVLSLEIRYDRGVIDGSVRQWNTRGELLVTSDLKKGSGVLHTVDTEQGLSGEMTYVDGKLTGRQRTYIGDELVAETYWIENEKIPKTLYRQKSEQDPKLPRYIEESRGAERTSPRQKSVDSARGRADEVAVKLLQGSYAREALSWLAEGEDRSLALGEAFGQKQSLRLVKRLYRLGAGGVHAVDIVGEESNSQNTGRLVVELPRHEKRRKQLLEVCKEFARETGFEAIPDVGHRYLLLLLD